MRCVFILHTSAYRITLGITDAALLAFSRMLPCLEELNVSQCKHVTDDGVTAVVRQLRRLQSLNVANCDSVTDKALTAIQTYGSR